MGEVSRDGASTAIVQETVLDTEGLRIGQRFWKEVGSQAVLDMKGSFIQSRMDERSQRIAFGIARLINGQGGIKNLDTQILTQVVRKEMLKFLEYYCTNVAQIAREHGEWKITDPDGNEGIGILEGILLRASEVVSPHRIQEFRTLGDKSQIPQRVDGLFAKDSLSGFDFYSSGEAMIMAGMEMAVMHLGGAFDAAKNYSTELNKKDPQVSRGAIDFAGGLVHNLGERIIGQAWWKKEEFLKHVISPPQVK